MNRARGDLPVGPAGGDERQHLALALGQAERHRAPARPAGGRAPSSSTRPGAAAPAPARRRAAAARPAGARRRGRAQRSARPRRGRRRRPAPRPAGTARTRVGQTSPAVSQARTASAQARGRGLAPAAHVLGRGQSAGRRRGRGRGDRGTRQRSGSRRAADVGPASWRSRARRAGVGGDAAVQPDQRPGVPGRPGGGLVECRATTRARRRVRSPRRAGGVGLDVRQRLGELWLAAVAQVPARLPHVVAAPRRSGRGTRPGSRAARAGTPRTRR